jgi:flavin-dependent dehydrogenase
MPRHNRGVYDARIAARRPKATLPDLLHDSLSAWPPGSDGARIEGHPIHWFSPSGLVSGERLVLAGDAAGAEPLFGEGIAPALGYGQIAARSVAGAFARNDFAFKDYKRRLLVSPLGRYLLLRWWTAWWAYRLSGRPWFMRMMWAVGKGLAAVTNRLTRNKKETIDN